MAARLSVLLNTQGKLRIYDWAVGGLGSERNAQEAVPREMDWRRVGGILEAARLPVTAHCWPNVESFRIDDWWLDLDSGL